jgi:hypothetical protein
MRTAAVLFALAALIASPARAETAPPAEVWKPMHWFIGTWKGTRAGTGDEAKVTRTYASATTNHHLEITEAANGRSRAVWGVVSFDAGLQSLVLRQFGADGSSLDAALQASSSEPSQVVFASSASERGRTRITYERSGANAFVERVELAAGGESYSLVSETRFVRKD